MHYVKWTLKMKIEHRKRLKRLKEKYEKQQKRRKMGNQELMKYELKHPKDIYLSVGNKKFRKMDYSRI